MPDDELERAEAEGRSGDVHYVTNWGMVIVLCVAMVCIAAVLIAASFAPSSC